MKKFWIVGLGALLSAVATPSFAAKVDCDAGYKSFLGRMSKLLDESAAVDSADGLRRSLAIYDACRAGDDFSPHGVWDKILADMQGKMKR
jgi:hypothetical protein